MLWGQSVFQGTAERATILVHQLPLKDQKKPTTEHVMTLTLPGTIEPCANSHIGVTDALNWDTTNNQQPTTISLQQYPHWPQLNKSTFQPVMPVQVDRLE